MADSKRNDTEEGFVGSHFAQQRFVLRYLSLAAIAVSLGFTAFFLLYDASLTWPAIVVSLAAAFVYALASFGIAKLGTRPAAYVLTLGILTHLSFGLAFFGTGSGLHLLYLVVVALFPRILASESRNLVIGLLTVTGIVLVSGVLLFPPEVALIPLPSHVLGAMHVANGVIAAVLIGGFALWAREHTDYLEKRLLRTNRNLRDLARSDALTGLLNRRGLFDVLGHEWARARRAGSPLTVLMIDIDHFKAYNDYYGHPAGDVCLGRFARVIEDIAQRPADVAARYGGEEFTVVLPGTAREGAGIVAHRLLQRLGLEKIPHGCPPGGPYLTASVGICVSVPSVDNDPGMLIARADEALYRAKRGGRNRVATS